MQTEFQGFPGAMAFLEGLKANNDRAWFNLHKEAYERDLKTPADAFAATLSPELAELAGQPVSAKVFRVHRDVRFSRDKTPYNTHLHIGFTPVQPAAEPRRGGYYFGLEPGKLTVGVGVFGFEPSELERYRRAAINDGAELARILAALGTRVDEPELKRVPAPFAADHPHAQALRRKSLTAWRDLDSLDQLGGPALAGTVLAAFTQLNPLNDWLTEALRP